jgi:hypothetical protein
LAKKRKQRLTKSLVLRKLAEKKYDKAFWHSRTPGERMWALEILRQKVYGYDPATARVERILTVVDLEDS